MALIDEIQNDDELQSIYVEEWNRHIFFYPFTLADADYATKMSKGKDGEFVAYVIIRKVLDSEGKKQFTVADKIKLMTKVDPDVLSRIVIDMKGGDDEDGGEPGKD